MNRRRAFTLIELLVVIAIIALLVSILMPSLQKAKELAKDIVCKSNQKSVAYAVLLYAEEYNDIYPYTTKTHGISAYIPFSWHVKVGKIPVQYINKDWLNWPLGNHKFFIKGESDTDPNATEFKICAEGYIDYLSWGDNEIVPFEGAFICPAFVDQVNPKSTWPGGTSCQFSMNGNISTTYEEWAPGPKGRLTVTQTSDVRAAAVLLGDGSVKQGGKIMVRSTFKTEDQKAKYLGELYILNRHPRNVKGRNNSGPWTHQRNAGGIPCDFYGHPGERANITYADGHVEHMAQIEHKAWKIK